MVDRDDVDDVDDVCLQVQSQLCRLAVGLEPPDAASVTRHVHGCEPCQAFVDDLGDVRGWLDALPDDPLAGVVSEPGDEAVARALARELTARFARDLLAVVEGKAPRVRAERERDRERLEMTLEPGRLDEAPWPEVFVLVETPPKSLRQRARALDLASALDPVGLDISLSHIATLVRVGDVERADAEADRWTRLV